MKIKIKNFKKSAISLSILTLVSMNTHAALMSLATQPLYLATTVPPNLTLILDDSGSMVTAYAPDDLNNYNTTRRYNASNFNPLAYNPNVQYQIPMKSDGTLYTTSFTAAYQNGFDTNSTKDNLSTTYRPPNAYNPKTRTQDYSDNPSQDYATSYGKYPAYYYVKDFTLSGCSSSDNDDKCYRNVKVTSTSGPGGTDERQNFAIWYSFYKTRNLLAASSANIAFQTLNPNVRVSWISLNTCKTFSGSCDGWDGTTTDNRVSALSGSHKVDFYNWVSRLPAANGTPLRTALDNTGKYYTTSGINSPYATTPQVTLGTESSCRQNFVFMITDGLWNSDTFSYGNVDNKSVTLPDGISYSPVAPYKDSASNTLADISFKYWSTDLRTDLANTVSPYFADYTGTTTQQYWNAKNDPATWQHLVTFTAGIGLTKILPTLTPALTWGGDTYSGSYSSLASGATSWPSASSDSDNNVADLWHAAINSRGQFFSADNPTLMSSAFRTVVRRVNKGVGSSSGIAANTTNVKTGTTIYQARFDSSAWSGDLLAIPLNSDGSVPSNLITASIWTAASVLDSTASTNVANRVIMTMKNSTKTGIPFRWPVTTTSPTSTELDASQSAYFSINPDTGYTDSYGSARLNFIRGDRTNEGSLFRSRASALGDIVDSSPVIVLPPTNYSSDSTYNSFKTANKNRTSVIYVGANDGILHGFRATDGVEVLGYVPSGVLGQLNKLTSSNYSHQYYINGNPNVGEVKFSDNSWHNILVSGMGTGAKGVFALDVTNPAFTEANAASVVKFEFTDSNDSDVGYIQGQPAIVKMNNGKYAAIFANGYNSTGTGQSSLYIVDIQTGALIKKISTGIGSTTTPNALATPTPIDADGNGTVDYVYAGDTYGKFWKFDLKSSSASSWSVAYSGSPLFDTGGLPITSQADVSPSPNGGYMVAFGTGKYIETSDPSDLGTYKMYGIWDDLTRTVSSANLVAQTVTATSVINGIPYRTTSSNSINYPTKQGWYLTLPIPGERVVTSPLISGGKVVFTSLIPSGSSCSTGGDGWVMELDYLTGSQLTYQVYDTSGNGAINTSDTIVSGMNLGSIGSSPTLLNGMGTSSSPLNRLLINESDGTVTSSLQVGSTQTSRRTAWREITKQ